MPSLSVQPHQPAALIVPWGPEEQAGAESLLLTQPSCPGLLASSSVATAWRKMKAFPPILGNICALGGCSLEDKSLEKPYIKSSMELELGTLHQWEEHISSDLSPPYPKKDGLRTSLQVPMAFTSSLANQFWEITTQKAILSGYPSWYWCSPEVSCPHTP